MSEKTGIEWATSTGNPWIGCSKVSPGCKNCYAAELDANKFSRTMGGATPENPISHWGKGAPRIRTKAFWKDALAWERKALQVQTEYDNRHDGTLREMFKPHTLPPRPDRPRIFPSLCDWLDEEVPIEWLADFLKLIHDTPHLDWLLLTKRPENWFLRAVNSAMETFPDDDPMRCWLGDWRCGNPHHNIWIGVSVEDQKRADERIPLLLQIPAKIRFLSVEPLLGPVEFSDVSRRSDAVKQLGKQALNGIHWVIGGLESGKDRRDSANGVNDLIEIAKQSVAAGIPFFCKQDCAFKPGQQGRIPNEIWALKNFPTTETQSSAVPK